jgi:sorting nexin-27
MMNLKVIKIFLLKKAIDDVMKKIINISIDKGLELKALQDNNRFIDYLRCVHKLDGYGDISFPNCACDARKKGHVIVIFKFSRFILKACSKDGIPEVSSFIR